MWRFSKKAWIVIGGDFVEFDWRPAQLRAKLRREIRASIVGLRGDANLQSFEAEAMDAPLLGPGAGEACRSGQAPDGHQGRNIVSSLIAHDDIAGYDPGRNQTLDFELPNFNCAAEAILQIGGDHSAGDPRQ